MKHISELIFIALCMFSCKAKKHEHLAIIREVVDKAGVPEPYRRIIGYDSAQFYIKPFHGDTVLNFCYPNDWEYEKWKKDTVYTEDTVYRLWGTRIKITPEIYITTRATKRSFNLGGGVWHRGICDSVTIDNYRIYVKKLYDDPCEEIDSSAGTIIITGKQKVTL